MKVSMELRLVELMALRSIVMEYALHSDVKEWIDTVNNQTVTAEELLELLGKHFDFKGEG